MLLLTALGDAAAAAIKTIADLNNSVNKLVWGMPMVVLMLVVGIYFSASTGFMQLTKAKTWFSKTIFSTFSKKNDKTGAAEISPFQALATSLAATIGTGNIAGVATAISIGGAGAVFWMWVSAFFGMMTKYAENVLGSHYRVKNSRGEWCGGPMYYIEHGLGSHKKLHLAAKPLASAFALFCVLASFGIGNMAQMNTISEALKHSLKVPPVASGMFFALAAGMVILGGIKRIGAFTEKLVPLMSLFYITGTLIVIAKNYASIGSVMLSIVQGAFGWNAAAGGFCGAAVKSAVSLGFKRGIFSNEAGLGSSVMAHSTASTRSAAVQGMWGIFEVFFDTFVVCTLTAFTVLSSKVHLNSPNQGIALVSDAFASVLGKHAGLFLSITVVFFAFSTIIGWSFYGAKAVEYLAGERAVKGYKLIFVVFVVISSSMDLTLAWSICDTLNALMALPNLIGLLLLSKKVTLLTKNYFRRQ